MKRCLDCNTLFVFSNSTCPACGYKPVTVDGFNAYAPDFAHSGGGFKATYFSELAKMEEVNFWFRSRNMLILWALEKYCQGFQSFLEIGCGTGYVLSGISKIFPHLKLYGSEIFTAGLDFASVRLPSIDLMQMDARNIPFDEEFDVIGAFDVIEHIEEDDRVLTQIYSALKPDGFLLLTVPQHTWLWSSVDEYACHVRRYTASELHHKVENAGFLIVRSTSFVTSLLPVMMISRLFQRKISDEKFDGTAELKIPFWINSILFQLLSIELAVIKNGINYPVGGSRFIIAKKA